MADGASMQRSIEGVRSVKITRGTWMNNTFAHLVHNKVSVERVFRILNQMP